MGIGGVSEVGGVAVVPCTRRQMEVFMLAAEDCHFACTASRLGISQAAVSAHIAALERQVGRPLFLRKRGRKPVLSRDGLDLLGEARAVVGAAGRAKAGRDAAESARQTIRVRAGGHLLDDVIKNRLPDFHRSNTGVDIECTSTDSPVDCARLVRDGHVDLFAYTVVNPACFPLHAVALKPVKLGLYVGRRFAASRRATASQLSALPFLLPPKGSPACALILASLRAAGIRSRTVAAHVQFASVGKHLAVQGQGVIALFDTMVEPQDEGDLIRVDIELATLYRTLFRAQRTPNARTRAVEQFLCDALC